MRRGRRCGLAAIAVIAFACYPASNYTEPPATTYTAAVRQLNTDQGATAVQSASVTPDFFRIAGIRPLLGRFIVEADGASSAQGVAVLSHDLWVQRFRSSPDIIGRRIDLDGRGVVVVGVAPPGFRFPDATQVWTGRGTAKTQ